MSLKKGKKMTIAKLLANLGDQCWTEHGGFLVFDKDEYNQNFVEIIDTWRIDCGDCEDDSSSPF